MYTLEMSEKLRVWLDEAKNKNFGQIIDIVIFLAMQVYLNIFESIIRTDKHSLLLLKQHCEKA